MAEVIAVRPQDTLETVLAAIGERPNRALVLWVPRGLRLLRQMEDYQALNDALRRHNTQLKILSPDARIVGLAMVFGVKAEIAAAPPADAPTDAGVDGVPDHPPAGVVPPPVAPASSRPGRAPGAARSVTAPLEHIPEPPAVTPTIIPLDNNPPPPASVSESDWLLSEDVNLAAILDADDLTRARSATPPPDVLVDLASAGLVPTAPVPSPAPVPILSVPTPPVSPPPPAPEESRPAPPAAAPRRPATSAPPSAAAPPAPAGGPVAGSRPAGRGRDDGVAFSLDPAPPPPSAPARPVPPAQRSSLEDDDTPAMSFAEWIALEGAHSGAAGTGPALPPHLDLDRLPAWLRESLAGAEPLPPPDPPPAPAPATAARKPFQPINPVTGRPATGPLFSEDLPPAAAEAVAPPRSGMPLRCPHCGEELDKEQMLRMLAEVWGL